MTVQWRKQEIQKEGAEIKFWQERTLASYRQQINIPGVVAQYHSKDDYLKKNSKKSEKKGGCVPLSSSPKSAYATDLEKPSPLSR